MFSNKKHYEALNAELKVLYEARIAELKVQYEARLAGLEKQLYNQTSATVIPMVALESDAILSAKDEVIRLSPEEMARLQDIESEAQRILTGEY